MKSKKKIGILWLGIFIFFFFLSQDYLFIEENSRLWWGNFPFRIYFFFFLQLAFSLAIFFFCQSYWVEEELKDT